jgi:hypothetical protein
MKLKTASLLAMVGLTVSYLINLALAVGRHPDALYLLSSALFNVPLILFFWVLYSKQE